MSTCRGKWPHHTALQCALTRHDRARLGFPADSQSGGCPGVAANGNGAHTHRHTGSRSDHAWAHSATMAERQKHVPGGKDYMCVQGHPLRDWHYQATSASHLSRVQVVGARACCTRRTHCQKKGTNHFQARAPSDQQRPHCGVVRCGSHQTVTGLLLA